MANEVPKKDDIDAVFKKLRAMPPNKICFDCQAKNPTWASVTYGVFICIDCSAVHRNLGVHLTFVRSTQLDTNWTWLQLHNMQLGGNANAGKFFREHNCTTNDAQQKYNSRAASLYREKLSRYSQQVLNNYGANINIDVLIHEPTLAEEESKELDFFEEQNHASLSSSPPLNQNSNLVEHKMSEGGFRNGTAENGAGPKVDSNLDGSAKPSQPRKSTIGQRKPASKLGAKKVGGLGAQKVKKDFASIERAAELSDQRRLEKKEEPTPQTVEEKTEMMVSLQEAYQNMGLATKREEERMKKIDPKKAEQAERLGMALGAKSGVSHSMFSEMKTIEQESPSKGHGRKGSNSSSYSFREPDIEDDFETVIRFATGPPKYKDSPFESNRGWGSVSGRGSGIDDLLSSKNQRSNSDDWENDFEKIEKPYTANSYRDSKTHQVSTEPPKYGNKRLGSGSIDGGDSALQKFGNAKAISSDMFFHGQDSGYETKTNLSRFEGSSSISSADFFGEKQTPSRMQSMPAPDLDDVKESVRQGVTKVAGRLSSIANNVFTNIQDRYT